MLHYSVICPCCKTTIHIPFMKDLEAKATADYNFAETDAQTKWNWVSNASFWELIKFWWGKK